MHKIVTVAMAIAIALPSFAQDKRDKGTFEERKPGYYQNNILKGIADFEEEKEEAKPRTSFKMNLEGAELPTDPDKYTQAWHNGVISQGNTGTCWCFSTTSFYESEIQRQTGKKVKLSEMYTVYWEYVERARYFVAQRGEMHLGEGSEANAVARMMEMYGVTPWTEYTGLKEGQKFHTHAAMFKELNAYLVSVKERSMWNEAEVVATTKSILEFHIGTPPTTFTVDGKEMTPIEYKNSLELNTTEYVNLMSLVSGPYYEKSGYDVPDNWWHSEEYKNIPLDDFMSGVKGALKEGFTISIGGDVSEAGFVSSKQVAMIPSFDIPSEYIDEDARYFRFRNKTTTDDHAMHIVGYQEVEGKTWFLVKDSGSGSRACGEDCKSFGYYFFHEDYIKLKMMTATMHQDAVKKILKKMKA
jgi:bleomycin hydrolase